MYLSRSYSSAILFAERADTMVGYHWEVLNGNSKLHCTHKLKLIDLFGKITGADTP